MIMYLRILIEEMIISLITGIRKLDILRHNGEIDSLSYVTYKITENVLKVKK
jgi:hypothetical protein